MILLSPNVQFLQRNTIAEQGSAQESKLTVRTTPRLPLHSSLSDVGKNELTGISNGDMFRAEWRNAATPVRLSLGAEKPAPKR